MNEWSGGIVPPFLTSAVGGGEWSISCQGHFTPSHPPTGERAPVTPWIEDWVSP
jgi:hypothetical protein